MHVLKKTNTKSLLNLPAVTDAKPSYAKPKGMETYFTTVSLMHCCMQSLKVISVKVNLFLEHT